MVCPITLKYFDTLSDCLGEAQIILGLGSLLICSLQVKKKKKACGASYRFFQHGIFGAFFFFFCGHARQF